jgi:hypothetical protein
METEYLLRNKTIAKLPDCYFSSRSLVDANKAKTSVATIPTMNG